MTPEVGLLLDALTLFLLLSYGVSLVVALIPYPMGDPEASARDTRRLLFAPPIVALSAIALGFWPTARAALGGPPDHCLAALGHYPHLCWLHPSVGAQGMMHDIAVMVVVASLVAIASWHGYQWAKALNRLKMLDALTVPERERDVRLALAATDVAWSGDVTVVSYDLPMCFVVGVRQPRLMISTAVLDDLPLDDLRIIVAHEAAHLNRKDNLWRLIGQASLLTHLPGLGKRSFHRWTVATEGACDAAAAERFGSRLAVAEALIRFQRLAQARGAAPSFGSAFGEGDALETRVRLLIDPPAAHHWHRLATLGPLLALLACAWQVDALHAALEGVLYLLHL